MTTFLQLHLLTSYPPACLNRDDLNRPKTAVMGGVPRLRISSQSLKRAWRMSVFFRESLSGNTGIRSKELGRRIRNALMTGIPLKDLVKSTRPVLKPDDVVTEKQASEWAWVIASEYVDKKTKDKDEETGDEESPKKGKGKKKGGKANVSKDTLKSEQVVFYSRSEIDALDTLIEELRRTGKPPSFEQLKSIKVEKARDTVDLALFGRMLASSPDYNVEAACQVAHAITVHRAAVDDDFFTAVDDLNTREEDAGSAHMGEQGFGAGLFYIYVCIDQDLLIENLQGDDGLAKKSIRALVEAAAKVSPTGKQNSFASRACAYYMLAEKGNRQPRSLSLAFMKPVRGDDMLEEAAKALESMRKNIDQVYYKGDSLESRRFLALVDKAEGDMSDLLDFIAK
jgi:CRISPR system Cascade subunit CasC